MSSAGRDLAPAAGGELRVIIDIIQRWWLTFLAAAIIGGVGGYATASQLPERYESHARVLVGPVNADIDTIRAAASLTETYAQIATSEEVLRGAIEELALALSSDDLREAMDVRTDQTTRIVTIGIAAPDAGRAADLANAIAQGLLRFATPVGGPEGELQVIDPALPAQDPVGPSALQIAGLAVIGAVVTAGFITLALESIGGRVRGPNDLRQLVPARYLGWLADPEEGRAISSHGPRGIRIEPAALLSRILSQSHGTPVRSLLVPAIEEADGTASLAVQLALVGATSDMRVAIVDANDLAPEVTRLHRDRSGHDGAEQSQETVTEVPLPELRNPALLRELSAPAGKDVSKPMTELLGDRYDFVVIHTAPLHRSGLAVQWADRADVALLAANVGITHREFLHHAVEALEHAGTPIVGSVILSQRGSARTAGARIMRTGSRISLSGQPAVDEVSVGLVGRSKRSRFRRRRTG